MTRRRPNARRRLRTATGPVGIDTATTVDQLVALVESTSRPGDRRAAVVAARARLKVLVDAGTVDRAELQRRARRLPAANEDRTKAQRIENMLTRRYTMRATGP